MTLDDFKAQVEAVITDYADGCIAAHEKMVAELTSLMDADGSKDLIKNEEKLCSMIVESVMDQQGARIQGAADNVKFK